MDRQPALRPSAAEPVRRLSKSLRRRRGITLLEILVVLGVLAIIAVFTVPELLKTMRRARVEGAAQTMTRLLLEARAEAIYRGAPVIVTPDRRGGQDWLVAWVDVDGNGAFGGTIETDGTFVAPVGVEYRSADYPLYEWQLPFRGNQFSDVRFWSAQTTSPEPAHASVVDQLDRKPTGVVSATMTEGDGYGDWERGIVFLDNGSVPTAGALRIGMGTWGAGDRRINFLELRIDSQASGRVELRKWIPGHGGYEPKGFASTAYDQHGISYEWEWY